MSRFSIRTQVLALAGAFCALLLATAGVLGAQFLMVERALTSLDRNQATTVMIAEAPDLLGTALDGVGRVLRNDAGGFDEIETALGRLSAARPAYAEAFADRPETREALGAMLDRVDAIAAQVGAWRGMPSFQLFLELNDRVVPALEADRAIVEGVFREILSETDAILTGTLAQMDNRIGWLLAGAGVAFAAALGLALVFSRLLSRPIHAVVRHIEAVTQRDYGTEMPETTRKDEIGRIARRLDTLRERLSEYDTKTEAERVNNDRRVALFDALGSAMSSLRDGRMDVSLDTEEWRDLGPGYARLCDDFNDLAIALARLVTSVRASVETVEANAAELAGMSMDMSKRAEIQAATLEESAAALEQLSKSIGSSAERAESADEKVAEGRQRAEQGGAVMARAMEAMRSIARSSEKITQIIGVIDDIAFQTNLLALNAGVEAARAGESGKGFSVVASEVRSLAQRAAESAREIKDLVHTSSREVADGERLVSETSETLRSIVASVAEVSTLMADISSSTREQASGVQEINTGVAELDKVTQQNAALVGETSAASQQLRSEARSVALILAEFLGEAQATTGSDNVTSDGAGEWNDARQTASERGPKEADNGCYAPVAGRQKATGTDPMWHDF